jgi:hypothetical protein
MFSCRKSLTHLRSCNATFLIFLWGAGGGDRSIDRIGSVGYVRTIDDVGAVVVVIDLIDW